MANIAAVSWENPAQNPIGRRIIQRMETTLYSEKYKFEMLKDPLLIDSALDMIATLRIVFQSYKTNTPLQKIPQGGFNPMVGAKFTHLITSSATRLSNDDRKLKYRENNDPNKTASESLLDYMQAKKVAFADAGAYEENEAVLVDGFNNETTRQVDLIQSAILNLL